jgi:uncharacterized protein
LQLPETDSGVAVILKLAGETCNINCHYCYEKRKPYPGADRLDAATLRRFLQLCGDRPLRVELHGGEPLVVGRERMAALFAEVRRYPAPVTMAIQTNGTLLSDTWIRFLLDEWPDLDIGVSLDGPAAINDTHRVDYRERGTTGRTEDALRRLADNAQSVGVIATVTRQSLGREREIVDYFAGLPGVRYLKFSPCLDFNVRTKTRASLPLNVARINLLNPTGEGVPGWGTAPGEYCDFMINVFDIWREATFRQFIVEPLYSLIRTLQGRPPSLCHFSAQKCAFVLTVYPDGRIGSCDELRMPDAALGHVNDYESLDDVLSMAVNPGLHRSLDSLLAKCSGCGIQDMCRGGCLATRLQYVGTPLDDEYCRYRARLIDHVRQSIGMSPLSSGTPWAPVDREPVGT